MGDYICIECGEKVSSLFVEYSASNIKLTRCDSCGNVADKYIEYELVLVLIDIVLHRVAAVRHLYRNRQSLWLTNSFQYWLMVLVIFLTVALKIVVLQKPYGEDRVLRPTQVFRIVIIALLEYLSLVFGYFLVLLFHDSGRKSLAVASGRWRFYLALSFPELLKMIAIVLQLFDCEPSMLLLLGLLIVSIQNFSLQNISKFSPIVLLRCTVVAIALKMIIRCQLHSISEIWSMGILL